MMLSDHASRATPLLEQSDEELAQHAHAGSARAFEALVTRYEPRLMAFLRSRGAPRADAEDFFQQTFFTVWRKLHQYDPERPFAPWLFTIAARLMAKQMHRNQHRSKREAAVAQPNQNIPAPPHDRAADANVWIIAAQVLGRDAHTALWLRYAEDMQPRHIAAVLGKRPGAVRVLLHRARNRLADALASSSVTTSAATSSPPVGATR